MTDIRAGDEVELDEDHLPWLEAVEEEDERSGPSPLKIIVSIVIGRLLRASLMPPSPIGFTEAFAA